MTKYFLKIKTLLTSFVTYAVFGSTVLTVVSTQLPTTPGIITKIIAALGASVAIVRKVTPVIDAEVGLDPVTYPTPAKTPQPPPPPK